MKIAIIVLSASALIATAPAALAKDASTRTPALHHKILKRHSAGVSGYDPWRQVQARGPKRGYSGAYGYTPDQPKDYTYENSSRAGGGGGGGGGGGSM